jgi:RND family efflux transporter MFP subunit
MNVCQRKLLTLPVLLAGAFLGLLGCSSSTPAGPAVPEAVNNVSLITAQGNSVTDSLEAIGTVRAARTAQIASQSMGNITEVHAQEGDHVGSGQLMAVIDDSQPRTAVQQSESAVIAAQKDAAAAETELALAQSTLKRYQQLFDKKSVSPQEFDEVRTRSEAAEARRDMARASEAQAAAGLAQAKTSLGNTQVRAPFAGVITEKKAEAGAFGLYAWVKRFPCSWIRWREPRFVER